MRRPGGRLTYSVVGSLKDGRLILKRANPSNGVGCDYVATIASEEFRGGAVCGGQQGAMGREARQVTSRGREMGPRRPDAAPAAGLAAC